MASSIWCSLKHCCELVSDSIRWLVCKTSSCSFWTDNWIYPCIADRLDISATERIGLREKILDVYHNNQWHLPPNVPPHILHDHIFLHEEHDICVWDSSSTGDFTVSSAYKLFQKFLVSNHKWHRFIWKEFLPPTRSLVCWRAARGYLPTEDVLMRKGFHFASLCRMCCIATESIEHLMVHCPFAKAAWIAISRIFRRSLYTSRSLAELLNDAARAKFSSQISALWTTAITSCAWLLWKTRNECIFEEVEPDINVFLRQIWKHIKATEFFKVGCSCSAEDFRILKIFDMVISPRRAPKIIPVPWHPPLLAWLKCNTDGCSHGTPGIGGAVVRFRNARGFTLGALASHLEGGFAFEAKLWTVIFAMEKAKKLGWNKIWVKSDSTYVVNLLMKKSDKVPWALRSRWISCLDFIGTITFRVSHIFREGNRAADALATFGAR